MLRRPRTRSCRARLTSWSRKGEAHAGRRLGGRGRCLCDRIGLTSGRSGSPTGGAQRPCRGRSLVTVRGPSRSGPHGPTTVGSTSDRGEAAVPLCDPAAVGQEVPEGGRGPALDVPPWDELGDFVPALEEFFGSSAGLSASSSPGSPPSGRRKRDQFAHRSLRNVDYVYVFADGSTSNVRLLERGTGCVPWSSWCA